MPTNPFFNNYTYLNEQDLIDSLVIESIKMYGIDTYYLTRTLTSVDHILNEDDLSIFNAAYVFEVYVKSVDGFSGEGDFLSKFGLQIRDQAVFTVAIRTFEKHVTDINAAITRPKEGDLIYFPMNRKFFKIMFVEHESVFYQTGVLQVYDLKCELFEYSNERFQTGIQEIDQHYAHMTTNNEYSLEGLHAQDKIAKNIFFEEEANTILDFSEFDPFSEQIDVPIDYQIRADGNNITSDTNTITSDIR
jgi:hypothetical protein